MNKYKTTFGCAEIQKVEVVRETKTMVFFNSTIGRSLRGEKKRTEFSQYHDTWDLAKKWLITKSEYDRDNALEVLRCTEKFYNDARALVEEVE